MEFPDLTRVHIKGESIDGECFLTVNGEPLRSEVSLKVRNHSPTGFNWSYSGSGPAQTALAILMEVLPLPMAEKLYQSFKFDFVAGWKMGQDFDLTLNLAEWLEKQK